MDRLIALHDTVFDTVDRSLSGALPLMSRFLFAATLFLYYWNSGLTKIIDRRGEEGIFDIFTLESGVYAQMFPKAFEAAGYNPAKLGILYDLVAYAGTFAEFLLPVLIVIGLATRLAALGMIGFVTVQTWVDVTGHGGQLGAWFDRLADGLIDERAFWVFLLLVLVIKGAGVLSVDRLLQGTGLGRTAAA